MTETTHKIEDLTPGEEVGFENPREKFDANDLKQLAADIDARGLLYPLQVWETEKDGLPLVIVVDGERRKRAIEILLEEKPKHPLSKGIPTRPIRAKTLKEAKYTALAGNIQRSELPSFDLAQEISRLKLMGDSQKTIAEALHKSDSWVSRKLTTYEKAGEVLRAVWKKGVLPDDTVEDLAVLDVDEQAAAVERVLKERTNGRAGKGAARKKVKKRASRVERATSKELQTLISVVNRDKKAAKSSDYVLGVYDALRFAVGHIGVEELGGEWKKFAKSVESSEEAE